MTYTVTLNPSLDYTLQLEKLRPGELNRCQGAAFSCGGKGINVSVVLHNLGVPTVALGFVAGFTGAQILSALQARGIAAEFFRLEEGCSRVNVKVQAQEETELNADGPAIPAWQLERLFRRLEELEAGDSLVLAGSLPAGLPADTYACMLARLEGKKIYTVVDTSGEPLRRALSGRPFLVKPNRQELQELYGCPLDTEEALTDAARMLQRQGARNVLVSLAGQGALLLGEDGRPYRQPAPQGKVVGSVGAGDSMVAGFLAGYLESHGNLQLALRTGLAAGSASAFSAGLATRAQVEALL